MKKKGFTLVELLAVIAILAILVIIALPNVLGMFNTAKKNTFVTELQSIYSTAETQFVSDSMGDMTGYTDGIRYARINGNIVTNCENDTRTEVTGSTCPTVTTAPNAYGYKKLDLSGNQSINYYIHFNLAGKVTEFYATDGQYQFIYFGSGLAKDKIASTDIEENGQAFQNGNNATVHFATGNSLVTDANTGVITIADAMSYRKGYSSTSANSQNTGWVKVDFSKGLLMGKAKGYNLDKKTILVQGN